MLDQSILDKNEMNAARVKLNTDCCWPANIAGIDDIDGVIVYCVQQHKLRKEQRSYPFYTKRILLTRDPKEKFNTGKNIK